MSVGRGVYWKKTQVEECKKLDILPIARKCDLESTFSGNISWINSLGRKSEIGLCSLGPSVLRFNYTITKHYTNEKKTFDYQVHLDTTPCNFGGKRWWFKCPHCWRRCQFLYLPPGGNYFLCRLCHNLTYESQQEGKTKFSTMFKAFSKIPELEKRLWRTRLRKKQQKIEKKIDQLYNGMKGPVDLGLRRRRRRK